MPASDTIKARTELVSNAHPMSAAMKPTYCGFREKRYGPRYTSILSSPDVGAMPRAAIAHRARALPASPRGYAQGSDIPLQQPSCARPLAKRGQAGRLECLVGQLHMRETGVVRDLPKKPVEVCEVARVTAPVRGSIASSRFDAHYLRVASQLNTSPSIRSWIPRR